MDEELNLRLFIPPIPSDLSVAGEKDRKSLGSSELILRIDSKLRNELMARSSTGLGRRRVDEEQIN